MANFFADDEVTPVVTYGGVDEPTVASESALHDFREEAVSAQRLAVSRLLGKYVAGRMAVGTVEYGRKKAPEKMFRVPKLVEWLEGDPMVILEGLQFGRLRCRLNARMGLGKSTRLAPFIAQHASLRVLHVSLEAHSLQQTAVYIRERGMGSISRRWSKRAGTSRVCYMTYADFNGQMTTPGRSELFASFDMVIFDEGFVPTADVFVAKRCFSVYAPAETHLIVCSATMKKDMDVEEMGSSSMGVFKQLDNPVSVEAAVASGKLVSDYLVDRTMAVVPTVNEIQELALHYRSHGVEVMTLDDADTYETLREVVTWLSGDCVVPRVLVAQSKFAIGFNFPVAYMILWPYEVKEVCNDDTMVLERTPMTEEMVAQAKARTGRGLVDGSGGVVMSPERFYAGELPESEKKEAFVKLCAASIEPLRTPFWESCHRIFPDSLPVIAAQNVLKVCLPVDLVVRYLGSDGRFASRFSGPLQVFSQPDHFPMPSDDEFPTSYESWVIGGCLVDRDGGEELRVPYHADGETAIVIAAVELLAQKRFSVPRWRPTRGFSMNDGYDSEEEKRDSRYGKQLPRLRRVEDRPMVEVVEKPLPSLPWMYRADRAVEMGPRMGGYMNSARCREALLEMEQSLLDYAVPKKEVETVIENEEGTVSPITIDGVGDVESPGGSVVCTLPVRICEKMNQGKELNADEYIRMITAARANVDRFVESKLFDCFAGPWESILLSLLNDKVAEAVVRNGLAVDTYKLVDRLRVRFSLELCSVLAGSHVTKKRFLKLFNVSPTMDSMMKAIREGKFDQVAQTKGFFDRVKFLKDLIDQVLVMAERQNVYLPTYISHAQRQLPLRGTSIIGYEGAGMTVMPNKVVKQLEGVRDKHRRYKSAGDDRSAL